YVFRSLRKGDDIHRISPEITRTDKGSATALAESPRDANVLYAGTDDGALWMTRYCRQDWHDLFGSAPDPASPETPPSGEIAAAPEAQPVSEGAAAQPETAPAQPEAQPEAGEAAPGEQPEPVADPVTG